MALYHAFSLLEEAHKLSRRSHLRLPLLAKQIRSCLLPWHHYYMMACPALPDSPPKQRLDPVIKVAPGFSSPDLLADLWIIEGGEESLHTFVCFFNEALNEPY